MKGFQNAYGLLHTINAIKYLKSSNIYIYIANETSTVNDIYIYISLTVDVSWAVDISYY